MKIRRRTFLKTGGSIITALITGMRAAYATGRSVPHVRFGREVAGRCPLCSLGCGLIYRSTGFHKWVVEGDPECPVGQGSLCARGISLVTTLEIAGASEPLYRAPGSNNWEKVSWAKAVDILARRLKDLRDRDLNLLFPDKTSPPNRFNSLGVIAGGCLTNEEAYTAAKLFRCLGVLRMDTTVRASHGMGLLGLMDTLGLPGATHPVAQIAYSDVVVLVGCNPGQTVPAVSRLLDKVRKRRGTVIIIDPRQTETVKKNDLLLRIRPGTDGAVIGAFVRWILDRGEINKDDLVDYSDAAFLVLSEIMGKYEKRRSGKYKNWPVIDDTLTEPYSIYQRMKEHFERYDLRKVAGITGVDIDLLRRACTLLAKTSNPYFSASFVFGSGSLGHHSGYHVVRMAAAIQALLGNLDKKGGGVILPSAAGNAQGVCDMGLLAPFFPGYLDLTENMDEEEKAAFMALSRSWFPRVDPDQALDFLPKRQADEKHSVSTVIQGIEDGSVKALLVAGADPISSLPANASMREMLAGLDLVVAMDSIPGRTCEFWKQGPLREETIKTEVLFIPTEVPAAKNGTMTDSGRRVRIVSPIPYKKPTDPGLLEFLVKLGNSIKSKYLAEGGILAGPILEMNWPLVQVQEDIAAEINGWNMDGHGNKVPIPQVAAWKQGDQCGNRLYRGWWAPGSWLASHRNNADPHGIGLFSSWGWFWPWGIPDPLSWIRERERGGGVYLRWNDQGGNRFMAADVLPVRFRLPVKFWTAVNTGSPFPEHYEPFYSPLPDLLTGGRSNPYLNLRTKGEDDWGYLSRRPQEVLSDFPVIVTAHRTGNVMGTGGIAALIPQLRELGNCRIVELGYDLADELDLQTGDPVTISSPYWEKGIPAIAVVTGRIGSFRYGKSLYHMASVTLYGAGKEDLNILTAQAFDSDSGGLEIKTFMGKITKV
jgi:formate dehydrogenase major subunit